MKFNFYLKIFEKKVHLYWNKYKKNNFEFKYTLILKESKYRHRLTKKSLVYLMYKNLSDECHKHNIISI